MNQYLYLFMKKMSSSDKIPPNGKLQPLFKLLAKISKFFHMNELEVVVWSLWLDNLCWTMNSLSLDETLYVAAIQTKEYLNCGEVVKVYKDELAANQRHIMDAYESWTKDRKHDISVGVMEINQRYNDFRQVLPVLILSLLQRLCSPGPKASTSTRPWKIF